MSSILDALRKLEQEKASRENPAAASGRSLNLDGELDLSPRHSKRSATGIAMLVVAGVLVIAGITAGVSTVVVMMTRHPVPPTPVAMNTPPVPQPAATGALQPVATPPAPEAPAATQAAAPVVPAPKPESVTVVKPVQIAQVDKQDPAPKPKPDKPAVTAPVDKPAPPAPIMEVKETVVEKKPAPIENVPLEKLPLLTESERVRLGLPPIKINIVGMPNGRTTRASALINMQKVYVGENIPDTDARLFDVDLHGIGLEVRGKRYYYSKN